MLWFAVVWAYVADHNAQTCLRVAQAVHIVLAPCVCNPGSLSKHPKFIGATATSFPRSVPSSVSSIRIPDGSHSCDVDAGICIFRAEQESSGSAGLKLHMSRPCRLLGFLYEGYHASINSVCYSRWYGMFPQLWGAAYGVADWCMYSESTRLSQWLTILLKQYSMVPLVVLHLLCDIDDKRTSWPLF